MAVFGGLMLTNKGRSLFAKAQAGKELKIKRVVIGDGELGGTESLLGLEQLKHEIVSFNIANIKTVNDKIAKILFVLKNEDIATGFYWRELGVIAEDPDTKEDILYCYGNARDNGDYIGAGGGVDLLEKYINIDLIIENVQNVTAVIDDSVVFIVRNEFESEIERIDEKISENERYTNASFVNMDSQIMALKSQIVTNENGTAIKFYDGTMICTKKCMFENVTTTANGAIFISPQQAIGDFALPFIDIPTMTLSKIGNNGGWVFNHTQLTKSSAGYVFFATTTAQSSKTFGCHLIAIGRWK